MENIQKFYSRSMATRSASMGSCGLMSTYLLLWAPTRALSSGLTMQPSQLEIMRHGEDINISRMLMKHRSIIWLPWTFHKRRKYILPRCVSQARWNFGRINPGRTPRISSRLEKFSLVKICRRHSNYVLSVISICYWLSVDMIAISIVIHASEWAISSIRFHLSYLLTISAWLATWILLRISASHPKTLSSKIRFSTWPHAHRITT